MEKRELVQKEAMECIQKNDYTGLYVIAPRVGKTKIVIDAVAQHWGNWNIYVATPREDINLIWGNEIIKWGTISFLRDKYSFNCLCFPSLKKIPENLDLLVIDECQMLSIGQMNMIKRKNPKRLLMVTGTANKYTRGKLLYNLGIKDPLFEYSIEQAIVDGIISNFHVYVLRVPLNKIDKVARMRFGNNLIEVTEKQKYDYLSAVFEDLRIQEKIKPQLGRLKEVYARRRAEAIYEGSTKKKIAKYIGEQIRERVLIFTARTEVADYLSANSYHSKNKGTKKDNNLQRFIEGEINTLSVVNMSDMGITFPNLKREVIHQLQSNSDTSVQKFLRTCNLEGDKEAAVVVTVYKDTMDESWAKQAIEGVPEDKVTWLELEELDDLIQKLR